MGMFWQYFSVEPKRWNALFDGSIPDAKEYFVASATWDRVEDELPDPQTQLKQYLDALWKLAPPKIVALADHVSRHGLSYRGLSKENASLLDSMVVGFFCPEGLESLLSYTALHSNGLASRAIEELLSRSQPMKLGGVFGLGGRISVGQPTTQAQWLMTGRRFDTQEAPNPEARYFILDSVEVGAMLSEVRGLLAVDRNWKTREFEIAVREELLTALETAAAGNRVLAARYT